MKKYEFKTAHPVLRETVFYRRMKCGLPVFVLPKRGFADKFAIFAVKYGSLDNRFFVQKDGRKACKCDMPSGVAHFLEHKLFEREGGNASDDFSKLGASSNAYTTYTHTAYYFNTTENFVPALKLLLNFVQKPYFTEESIIKEREIIRQEIRMYRDDPDSIVFNNLMTTMYEKHPIREEIAGTEKSIALIDKDVIETCYRGFYHPKNMALIVSADVSPEKLMSSVEKEMYWHDRPAVPAKPIEPTRETKMVKRFSRAKLPVSIPKLLMASRIKKLPTTDRELVKQNIAISIALDLIFGKSAPLYNSLYNSGLIDSSFSSGAVLEKNFGFVVIGSDSHNPHKMRRAIEQGIKKARKDGLSKSDFERHIKRNAGKLIRLFDSPESAAHNCLYNYFRGLNMFESYDILIKTKFSEVVGAVEQAFDNDGFVWSLGTPDESK